MPGPFEPTPAQVKALIPTRLDGDPFSIDTRPSIADVEGIISDVATEVAEYVEDEIPAELYPLAKAAVKRGAAAEIEGGQWPEQQDSGDTTTYARLIRRYVELKELLKRKIGESDGAGTVNLRSRYVPEDV